MSDQREFNVGDDVVVSDRYNVEVSKVIKRYKTGNVVVEGFEGFQFRQSGDMAGDTDPWNTKFIAHADSDTGRQEIARRRRTTLIINARRACESALRQLNDLTDQQLRELRGHVWSVLD